MPPSNGRSSLSPAVLLPPVGCVLFAWHCRFSEIVLFSITSPPVFWFAWKFARIVFPRVTIRASFLKNCRSPLIREFSTLPLPPSRPFPLHQPPGVAAGHGGEPRAEVAVLRERVQALKQEAERKLGDVRGVLAREPVAAGNGEHEPLVAVQHPPPRLGFAPLATQDRVSVRPPHGRHDNTTSPLIPSVGKTGLGDYEQVLRRADPVWAHRRVPAAFANAVDACLEPDPDRRPTLQDLTRDLTALT
jgi:hypothetical protein